MRFKWDWEKRELVEGEPPEREKFWFEPFLVFGAIFLGYLFIEFICPSLGHTLFGRFL